jgi:hypothetical protein
MRSSKMNSERRREPRDEVSAPVAILWMDIEGREARLQAHLVDISVRGAKMRVPQKLPPHATVYFYHYKLGIGGRGRLRYCNTYKQGYEIGLEFPGGTGWKSSVASDLSTLAEAVGSPAEQVKPELDPHRS